MFVVVDTNVPVVANNKSMQALPECVIKCVTVLDQIKRNRILVIDDKWLIITEYRKNLSEKGQPGVGDAFLKWVLTNQGNPQRCQRVQITPIDENNFAEFPQDESLAGFDKSDRKFVAVALTHPQKPRILNAVDSDWQDFQVQLAVYGVQVEFVCGSLTK
ncbi:hypothetical protein [[Phormidium] sp. ETS-05]|uniref:hypothetical protein n=1 Tax=[Phormidium] sp. ETS-05 TaxID=222819 RepID=UPI0018EF0FE5|nr:hypothetical protein [[Phormidium] sp. ETS-05]